MYVLSEFAQHILSFRLQLCQEMYIFSALTHVISLRRAKEDTARLTLPPQLSVEEGGETRDEGRVYPYFL